MGLRPVGRVTVAVVALWSTAALAGCGMVLGEGGTKAGGQSLPVTLHLGTVESGQPPYRLFVEEFAREVERRSEGAIRVAVDWEANPWNPDSERTLAVQVDAGDIDLALLPDRILSGFGASALDAVHTPFLIDSMALADAVASDELGVAMLADIPLSVGLALVPEDLRYPAGYGRALTAADDFLGLRTRTAVAEPESSALLQALGAIPVAAQSLGEALSDGLVDAAETAYPYVRDFPDGMIYTANMAFFPKMNVLVAAQRSFDALPAQQQDLLRDAAHQARDTAAELRPSEPDGLVAVCTSGRDAVLAPEEELAVLEARAAPVIAELRQNPATAEAIDEITRLKALVPTEPVVIPEVCGAPTGDSARPDD